MAESTNPIVKLYQNTLGRTPSQEEIDSWNFGSTIDARELDRFLGAARNEAVNTKPQAGAVGNIARQILAQGTTDKWAGEGFGSPEKNAYDMAVMLAGQGITDIKDFGQRTTADGNKEFFNKLTGEAINPYYDKAARVGPDIWGGTFAGKDSTAYGVKFDAAGNPLFFSQYGGDSADVPSWVAPALVLGAAYFGLDASGLLAAGAGAGAGAAGLTAAEIAGLTATDLAIGGGALAGGGVAGAAAAGLTAAEIAALNAGDLAIGSGGGLLSGGAGATTGVGATTAGLTAAETAALTSGDLAIGGGGALTGAGGGSLTAGVTAADIAASEAALTTGAGAAGGSLTAGMTAADVAAAEAALPASGLLSGLTTAEIASLIRGGLTTTGGLLQQQTSREAAVAAQKKIDDATAAAVQASQFRPVGTTTRFGSSQFQFDPVTGQLKTAGYELAPDIKAQQDRLIALSNAGLTQAEQAQQQFAPLQTGAQSLFTLGNKYLAQSPEEVAQRYINSQMSLLQPGRELELANLQNKLLQQGRSGVAVAQGGNLGATTPELQALFNARATQEAKLAAEAEIAGQNQVTFGAGLLTKGAGAMGDYYAGQTAAYAPYKTPFTQAQTLETLGQKPFDMSTALAKETSAAGARSGELALRGSGQSVALSTGAAATTNPYSTVLSGLSDPTSTISQGVADYIRRNWL